MSGQSENLDGQNPENEQSKANAELRKWIISHADSLGSFEELFERLAKLTIPDRPYDTFDILVQPFAESLDPQLWPWNLAAGTFINKGKPEAAIKIWSGMYLAILKLQRMHNCRFHKGMPLCNLGYAIGKTCEGGDIQLRSWLLGIVEDYITNPDAVEQSLNFKNARSMRKVADSMLRQLVATVQTRFLDLGVTPIVPEVAIEVWSRPASSSPSADYISRMSDMLDELCKERGLPESSECWTRVRNAWGFKSEL